MLTGDLKWGLLRLAEAFVLPSHQENFGIAVAEALACGTPVLISNKVNIWREIAQDRAGLVEADDEPGTTRLLEGWLGLPLGEQEEMRKNAQTCFQSRFEVTRAAEGLIETMAGQGLVRIGPQAGFTQAGRRCRLDRAADRHPLRQLDQGGGQRGRSTRPRTQGRHLVRRRAPRGYVPDLSPVADADTVSAGVR